MLRTFVSVLALAAVATLAAGSASQAQNDPIVQRQNILKGFGKATGPVGDMLKGQAPFDLAKVQFALDTYTKGAPQLPPLFPDTSKTGNKTEALPAIWENKADFNGRYVKLGADAKAARIAIKDEATFKANFPAVLKNCGGCHEKYRMKK